MDDVWMMYRFPGSLNAHNTALLTYWHRHEYYLFFSPLNNWSLRNPVSCILYPVSCILHPTKNIEQGTRND